MLAAINLVQEVIGDTSIEPSEPRQPFPEDNAIAETGYEIVSSSVYDTCNRGSINATDNGGNREGSSMAPGSPSRSEGYTKVNKQTAASEGSQDPGRSGQSPRGANQSPGGPKQDPKEPAFVILYIN
jgi:hypothetical protein